MESPTPTFSSDSPDPASSSAPLADKAPSVDGAWSLDEAPSFDDAPPQPRTDADAPAAFASVSPAEALALSLSPPQRTAIQMLTSGKTAIDSAVAAGVSRRTLYRWLNTDANFKAAYNAWQHDAIATARGKVLALTDVAIDAVRRAMAKGDAKTALVILKSTGILDRPDPGSTDPEEVKAREAIARERTEPTSSSTSSAPSSRSRDGTQRLASKRGRLRRCSLVRTVACSMNSNRSGVALKPRNPPATLISLWTTRAS